MSSGRLLRRVTALPPFAVGTAVRLAPATTGGRLFLTVAHGARCEGPKHEIFMECPHWQPGSCRNTVEALSPGQSRFSIAFTVGGGEQIDDAVPDPAGNEVALTMTACVSIHGPTGLFIRGLRSGRLYPVSTSRNRCDGYGPTAWNQAGTELAFVLERAGGQPQQFAGGLGCPAGSSRLALASTDQKFAPTLKLIDPDHGCMFRAVAFDSNGIAAAEGCNRHSPPNEGGSFLGQAVLVQYDPAGHVLSRELLKPGLEDAELATLPGGHQVLITQSQPANSGYPPRDWVWESDGHHLHAVASYKSGDADQILAIPW